jgi:anti-repressor protein
MAKIYKFKKVHEVRVDDSDSNNPWFVAKDVCSVLGLGNTSMAVKPLDDDEKGINIIDTLGGKQRALVVNEPGLYRLISASRKPFAKEFQRWVYHEVLPEIRKTGAYVHDEEGDTEEMLIAKGMLAAGRAIDRLKAKVAELEPKALVHGTNCRVRTE